MRTALLTSVAYTRPASVLLSGPPLSIHSSPDGLCLLVAESQSPGLSGVAVRAYHIASFGSSSGIGLEFEEFSNGPLAVTSFLNKSRCHIVHLGVDASASTHVLLQSAALQITHKNTEFMFQTRNRNIKDKKLDATVKVSSHNCLVDCHRDVWTRFPVVPAVQRQTLISTERRPRSFIFVSKLSPQLFEQHFSDMIFAFVNSERKPVSGELSGVCVTGSQFDAVIGDHFGDRTSVFRSGEWLVDILCLIPIQIAVTRKNGFYPIQDGVWSQEFESSILGATVEQVIDSLSFGWYESVFESYMAAKASD